MADVFLGLGSNLGDRLANLAAAREALRDKALVEVRASSIYETAPWGPVAQGYYLNQVVQGRTDLPPRTLLETLQAIERELGRDRVHEERYGPRTIDLDILLYGAETVREASLEIPHPRMMQRAFVLVPLAEIAPGIQVRGVAARDAVAALDRSGVARYAAPA
jgi:2-amino-4-hydroxy-6-hydroxymethyldihydropteridine diphosphokinase